MNLPALSFGRWLRFAREEAGYQQKRAALALGVSPATLSLWETDKRDPRIEAITDMIRLYDAPWLGDVAREQLAKRAPWLLTASGVSDPASSDDTIT